MDKRNSRCAKECCHTPHARWFMVRWHVILWSTDSRILLRTVQLDCSSKSWSNHNAFKMRGEHLRMRNPARSLPLQRPVIIKASFRFVSDHCAYFSEIWLISAELKANHKVREAEPSFAVHQQRNQYLTMGLPAPAGLPENSHFIL